MNIGMILDNEFDSDMRVQNEVIALQNAGFNVFVLCFNHGTKNNHEKFHDATIVRAPLKLFSKNKMKGLANTLINIYPVWWAKQIVKFVKQYKIDAIHLHDLYMLDAGLKARKKLKTNIPLVADLHENYVEGLKHYKFANTFPGNVLISIPKWEKSEIVWVKKMDHMITVIEEAVERYKELGVDENKISVVANYVNLDEFLAPPNDEHIINRFKESFTILYVGGFDIHRGLEATVKSLPAIIEKIPNAKLILVGGGRNEPDLKELAKQLNVEDHIEFAGWQPPDKLPSFMIAADVCLVPHLKTVHTDNTIPHKLFQYMILQKPVIVSNCNPLKRIVEETQTGLVFESDNHQQLAECVLKIYKNPDKSVYGDRGKKAVEEKYNWNATAQDLVKIYQNLNG